MPLLCPAGSASSRPASFRRLQPHTLARSVCVSLLMYAALLSPLRQQARAFNVLRPLSMSMSAASTPSAQKLRVVTYNILTPNYATPRDLPVRITFSIVVLDCYLPDVFYLPVSCVLSTRKALRPLPSPSTFSLPLHAQSSLLPLLISSPLLSLQAHPAVHLDEQERLQKILTKLEAETAQGAVIALQEISRAWAGHLHVFFARAGYHFVHSGYGRPSSGFMGVGLAWPHNTLEASTIDISRLADAKPWPAPPPPGTLTSVSRRLLKPFRRLFGMRGRGNGKDEDVMASARDRSNAAIIAQLRSKEPEGLDFFIACYHMPCEFRRPPIMTVHAALLVQRMQALAKGKPHIVTVSVFRIGERRGRGKGRGLLWVGLGKRSMTSFRHHFASSLTSLSHYLPSSPRAHYHTGRLQLPTHLAAIPAYHGGRDVHRARSLPSHAFHRPLDPPRGATPEVGLEGQVGAGARVHLLFLCRPGTL